MRGWTNSRQRLMAVQTSGWMDGWMDGWICERDNWLDGRKDECMDQWAGR